MEPDIVVIGGGTVGAAIAYGLAKRRQNVLLLDGDDGDFRAAHANFGLVWLQGKGLGLPAYQALTRASIALWRGFCDELVNFARSAYPDAEKLPEYWGLRWRKLVGPTVSSYLQPFMFSAIYRKIENWLWWKTWKLRGI